MKSHPNTSYFEYHILHIPYFIFHIPYHILHEIKNGDILATYISYTNEHMQTADAHDWHTITSSQQYVWFGHASTQTWDHHPHEKKTCPWGLYVTLIWAYLRHPWRFARAFFFRPPPLQSSRASLRLFPGHSESSDASPLGRSPPHLGSKAAIQGWEIND